MLLQFEEAVNTLGGLKKDLTEVRVSLWRRGAEEKD